MKNHAENHHKSHHRSFGDKLDDPQNDPNEYFTVHPTDIRTREFSSEKKIARNMGTHFRQTLDEISSKDWADKEIDFIMTSTTIYFSQCSKNGVTKKKEQNSCVLTCQKFL